MIFHTISQIKSPAETELLAISGFERSLAMFDYQWQV